MFPRPISCDEGNALHHTALLASLAQTCTRPRYAFMLLSLLAKIARPDGSAGPLVASSGRLVPLREWLCDALSPLAERDTRRRQLAERAQTDLAARNALPGDPALAALRLEQEVKARILASGMTNVSRTVSELVKSGLLRRHYQGYRVDHANRGARRQVVYTLDGQARRLLPSAVATGVGDTGAGIAPSQLSLL